MVYKDLDVLNKLYAVREILIDINEKEIINSMIQKRKVDFKIENEVEFSKKELSSQNRSVRKALKSARLYVLDVYDLDIDYYNDFKNEEHYDKLHLEIEKKYKEFQVMNAIANRNKEKGMIFLQSKQTLLIYFEQEFIELILKNRNYETGKH